MPYILFIIDMFPVEQRCIFAGPTMVQRFPSGSRCALFLDKQGHTVNWSCALYHNEREKERETFALVAQRSPESHCLTFLWKQEQADRAREVKTERDK